MPCAMEICTVSSSSSLPETLQVTPPRLSAVIERPTPSRVRRSPKSRRTVSPVVTRPAYEA